MIWPPVLRRSLWLCTTQRSLLKRLGRSIRPTRQRRRRWPGPRNRSWSRGSPLAARRLGGAAHLGRHSSRQLRRESHHAYGPWCWHSVLRPRHETSAEESNTQGLVRSVQQTDLQQGARNRHRSRPHRTRSLPTMAGPLPSGTATRGTRGRLAPYLRRRWKLVPSTDHRASMGNRTPLQKHSFAAPNRG